MSRRLARVMTTQPQRQFAADVVEVRRDDVTRPRQRDFHLAVDPAGARRHYHHLVGEEDRLLDRMRYKQHGQARALLDFEQFVLKPFPAHGVERAERLVHQDDLGIVREHARDRDALLHAAGELMRIGIDESLQPHQFDEMIDGLLELRRGRPRKVGPKAILPRTVSHENSP